jgi:hypothetical protein
MGVTWGWNRGLTRRAAKLPSQRTARFGAMAGGTLRTTGTAFGW